MGMITFIINEEQLKKKNEKEEKVPDKTQKIETPEKIKKPKKEKEIELDLIVDPIL